MTNEEAKRYMQSKYNCDLLTINGVVFVPLYQIIDRIEQPAPAVPLDRIKATACDYFLQILDKLIAESEG